MFLFQVVSRLPDDGVAPSFGSFNLWGDFGGPDADFDEASGMIFYGCKEHYREVSRATGLFCPIAGCRGSAAETGGHSATGKRGRAAEEQEAFPSKGVRPDGFEQTKCRRNRMGKGGTLWVNERSIAVE